MKHDTKYICLPRTILSLPEALWLRRAPALIAAGFLLLGASSATLAAGSQPLASHLPPSAKTAKPLGRLDPSTRLTLTLGLPLRNQTELNQLIADVSDPSSPRYRQFLSSAEFTGRFGPAEADYQTLANFARSNGLSVDHLHPNRTLLGVSGTAADIERVFHVTLHRYQHPKEPREFFAPESAPSIDLDLPLLDVTGLDNYSIPRRSGSSQASKPNRSVVLPADVGTESATPGIYSGRNGSGPYNLYLGSDFRNAYAPGVTLTGVGQTVGFFEEAGYDPGDISAYESIAGLPQVPLTNVLLDNATGLVDPNLSGEVTGDIEQVVAMAPGLSQVIVYEGLAAFDQPFEILNRMATDNLAKQLSCSWFGFPESPLMDQVFRQFVIQGQSFFAAAGDSLAYYAEDPPPPPDDSPYVTVVGGTELTTTTNGGAWIGESVWLQGFTGTGGGVSATYPIPSWQQNVNMSLNQGSTTMRNIPDVAAVAIDIFAVIGGSGQGISGTSFATPLWAGFTALVNQQAAANGAAPVGFLNPALYALGGGQCYESLFHDITNGNNISLLTGFGYDAVQGYDLCTGWGSPGGCALINALAPPDALRFRPENGLAFGGLPGGPFTPSPQMLCLTNASATSLSWSLSNSAQWLQVSSAAGSLAAGAPAVTLAVSLTPAANNLAAGQYLAWVAVTDLGDGAVLNIPVTLTVASSSASFYPPIITNQPTSQLTALGVPAVFTVGASGPAPLFFQWQFNETNLADGPNITGATSSTLLIANVSAANLGAYSVVVSNLAGATVSVSANLEFPQAPLITSQPVSQSVSAGSPVSLSVSAVGGQPLAWQWLENGLPLANGAGLSGASSDTLDILSATTNLAGNYSVIVSNSFGAVTSAIATLSISLPYVYPGASLTTLYTFTGTLSDAPVDGYKPVGGLLLAPDGAFYGVTEFGGTNYSGEIFRVTTGGQFSVIHYFGFEDNNGGYPQAGLSLGSDGALYGTTSAFGPDGNGTVFRVTTNGVLTTLHAFVGDNEGANCSASLTLAPDGSFYGDTTGGGPDGYGTVFNVTTNGVLTTLYSFTNGLDGADPSSPLTWAADGTLYGQAPFGGSASAGTIFRITPAGQFSLVYSFSGGDDGSYPGEVGSALRPAPDGGFYGCAYGGGPTNDSGSGTVFEVYINGSFNVIYAFTGGDDGSGPTGLLLAPDGSLFGTAGFGGPSEAFDPAGVGYGILFNLETNGLLSIAASFGGTNGGNPFAPLVFGAAGQIYGTTQGPLLGNPYVGTIFRLNLPVGSTNAPPVIISQPFSQFVQPGNSAVFIVDAVGSGTLSYQWSENGTNLLDSSTISGTSSNILTILDISAADAGTYTVLVSNAMGSVISSNALLTVVPGLPPAISGQPASQIVPAGAAAVFAVTAFGYSPLSFQWLKNGASLSPGPGVSGISNSVLTLLNISTADTGSYSVIVSDLQGSVTSSNALLDVSSDNAPGVVLQTLFSFTNGNPSGLVRGPDGAIYGVTANGGSNAAGTLFRVCDAAAPPLLYTFTGGADGANPSGRLIVGADGNIYGVTTSGGSNGGWGTIFKASLEGTITTLHSFAASDGSQPYGALLQNPAGDFYGTTSYGGIYGFGTLFEITTNGVFSSLYSFGGFSGDGTAPLAGLTPGLGGVLYGTTSDGGSNNAGEIFELGANGAPSMVCSFGGFNGYIPMELTPGPNGALYGVALYGGPNFNAQGSGSRLSGDLANGLVFSLDTNGVLNTIPFNGANGSNPKAALVLGADGNLYGTTAYGGPAGLGTVFRVQTTPTPAITTLFLFNGSNGANPESALVLGTNGDFYGTTLYGGANGQGTIFHLTVGAPAAPPQFLTSAFNQGVISFSWSAIAGQVYQVQFISDLTQPNWNILTTLTATGPTASATDSPGANNRFYRVVLLPLP